MRALAGRPSLARPLGRDRERAVARVGAPEAAAREHARAIRTIEHVSRRARRELVVVRHTNRIADVDLPNARVDHARAGRDSALAEDAIERGPGHVEARVLGPRYTRGFRPARDVPVVGMEARGLDPIELSEKGEEFTRARR